jgi:sugar phosphate permease
VINPWRRIFAPFAVGYFLSYLLRNANAVISPELTGDLGLSAADLGLLTSAYLFAFGAFQLPLGILLDRYGPRRVEAVLLLICAAGCALFATGAALPQLSFGRALIGLGALAASSPLGALLPLLGWRGIFLALAALSLLAAALIFSTPEKPLAQARETLRQQLAGLATVFRSRLFWCLAPQTTFIVGGFMALQGLWAVPWLMTVDGLSREQAAFHLLLLAGAQLCGFLSIAFFVQRLTRAGLPPGRLLALGMGFGLLVVLGIVLDAAPSWLLWPSLGLVFATGNLAYAVLTAGFPLALAGRANTALNLGAFAGAFGIQWLFGVAVVSFEAVGLDGAAAYRASMAGLLVLQAAAWSWYLIGQQRSNGNASGHAA